MRLRAPTPDDLEAAYAVIEARDLADVGFPDYTLLTAFREEHLEAHDTALDLSLVACEEERIVGFLVARCRGALHLYESAGMTPRLRHDIYERPPALASA